MRRACARWRSPPSETTHPAVSVASRQEESSRRRMASLLRPPGERACARFRPAGQSPAAMRPYLGDQRLRRRPPCHPEPATRAAQSLRPAASSSCARCTRRWSRRCCTARAWSALRCWPPEHVGRPVAIVVPSAGFATVVPPSAAPGLGAVRRYAATRGRDAIRAAAGGRRARRACQLGRRAGRGRGDAGRRRPGTAGGGRGAPPRRARRDDRRRARRGARAGGGAAARRPARGAARGADARRGRAAPGRPPRLRPVRRRDRRRHGGALDATPPGDGARVGRLSGRGRASCSTGASTRCCPRSRGRRRRPEAAARGLAERLRKHGPTAISSLYTDPAELHRAVQEAELVLEVVSRDERMAETMSEAGSGVYRLLFRVLASHPDEMRSFFEDTVAPGRALRRPLPHRPARDARGLPRAGVQHERDRARDLRAPPHGRLPAGAHPAADRPRSRPRARTASGSASA